MYENAWCRENQHKLIGRKMGVTYKNTILVVDDEHGVRQSFQMLLKDDYNFLLAKNGQEAKDIFVKNSIDLVLLDILLPDEDGLKLLAKIKDISPETEVVMVTAVNEIKTAVKAIKSGAFEYIIKPFIVDDVLTIINRALAKRQKVGKEARFRHERVKNSIFEKMVSKDEKMHFLFGLIETISQSNGSVLIQGESGTGKELVARAIHNRSPRSKKPFVVVNCAAIPETLMEREIFGHVRGAFTGAMGTRIGKLETANMGTVFLDDIDSLDVNMQGKLLRIIQEKELERLGSTEVVKVDIRFIAASNKDFKGMMAKGSFREDLYYRLNVFPIMLPPLRERKRDIPLLLNYFLDCQAVNSGKPKKNFSLKAIRFLKEYNWPGNIRELENLVERLCTVVSGDVIHLEEIFPFDSEKRKISDLTLKEAVNAFEQQYITEVLENVGGNRKLAAERLGIHRNTLLSKTNTFNLDKNNNV